MNYKELDIKTLRGLFRDEQFQTEPLWHQYVTLAWAIGEELDRIALWHDIGTGKSLTALYLAKLWGAQRLLIVCPNSVIKGWREQIETHTKQTYIVLDGAAAERKAKLSSDADIFLVNYEGLRVLWIDKQRQKKKIVAAVDATAVKAARFDTIVFDESHALKSGRAQQTRVAHALAKQANWVITMTGTPIGTGEADLWSEFWVLDDGRTLGANFFAFLRKYFTEYRRHSRTRQWSDWTIAKRDELMDRVAYRTLRFSRTDCADLPERVYQVRPVTMSKEQHRLIDHFIHTLDPLQASSKLAQVAGGFYYQANGSTVRLATNPKLAEWGRILQEVDGKIIIFHQYVEEGKMLEELCRKLCIRSASLRAEIADKDTAYQSFKADPNIRVLIAHPKSGGAGLNLQEASIAGFFSNGWDGAITRDQAEGRIWRQGQCRKCLYVDTPVVGSIDERKLAVCHSRASKAQTVLDYVRDWQANLT